MSLYISSKLTKSATMLMASLLFSVSANAATVWLVERGNDSSSNAPGTPLIVAPGSVGFDLYMDTLLDTSTGWTFDLSVSGNGAIDPLSVSGSFLDVGSPLPNGGGWRQIGGDISGQSGKFLTMRFDFQGTAGAGIDLSGSFVNSSFLEETIPNSALLRVVPLPGAGWLLGSALVGLIGLGRARKSD